MRALVMRSSIVARLLRFGLFLVLFAMLSTIFGAMIVVGLLGKP